MKRSLPTESERQQVRHFHNTADNKSSVSQAFVDNRNATTIRQQLMAAMVSSPRSTAQRMLSQQMHDGPRMLAQRKLMSSISGETVQRVEDEELLQGKFNTIQRVEEDEELLQGKFTPIQRMEEEEPMQAKSESVQQQEPNNTGLPDNLKNGIEQLSGMSMDDVKVHYNSSEPAQLNALAYAQGTDIHLSAGQEKHLPHEAWHVVQQAQGRVQPTMQMAEGTVINDDQGLEQEADVMGEKAARYT